MEVLILIGAIQAVFFVFLVLSKKNKSISDKILAFWLSIFAVHLAFIYFSYKEGHVFYIDYGFIPAGLIVVYYSLMYVYTLSLMSKENRFNRKWLIHLIPTIITYIGIVPLAMLSYEDKADLLSNITSNNVQNLVFGIIMLFVTIYLIATLRLLRKHQLSLRKLFSYEEDINLNWLRVLTVLLILLWVIISSLVGYVFYIGLSSTGMPLIDAMTLDMQGSVSFVIFVFVLGYFGIKQQVIYSVMPQNVKEEIVPEEVKKEVEEIGRYKKSGLKQEDSQAYLNSLTQYMENEKPFLNGKLSLKEVATELGISTNHLSQVINENLDKNFFDFVNEYRVELVKTKMQDPVNRKFTILHIALDCGFNSKSSFNTIFKKYTGLTPSAYMKTGLTD